MRKLMDNIAGKRIGFVYPRFHPITGGGSVHGYHLAYGLHQHGFEICILEDQDDHFTRKYSKSLFGAISFLQHIDVLYYRNNIENRYVNIFPMFAKMLGKKVIIEINGPSDELVCKGRTIQEVEKTDRIFKRRLKYADAVITVSNTMKRYCTEVLGLENVTVIENGGSKTSSSNTSMISHEIIDRMNGIRGKFRTVAIWSGTAEPWQGLREIRELISLSDDRIAYLILSNDKSFVEMFSGLDNVFVFISPSRDDSNYLIQNADLGLAIYGDYSWSRFGFYGSSLKFFEYLANDLFVIASPLGHMQNHPSSRVGYCTNAQEGARIINSYEKKFFDDDFQPRSWDDVTIETIRVMESVLSHS